MSGSAQDSRKREILRFIVRILVIWGIEVVAVLLMTWLLPGVWVDSLLTAILAVAAMGVVNALLWPILSYLLLPFAVLSFGALALVLNAFLVLLASDLVEGFHVVGLLDAILLVLGVTGVNSILSSLLTIDYENSWYRNVVRRAIRAWLLGQASTVDRRPAFVAAVLMVLFLLLAPTRLADQFFKLTALGEPAHYVFVGAVVVIWALTLLLIWRTRLVERYLNIDFDQLTRP